MLTRNLRKWSIALLAVSTMLLGAVPAFAHDGPGHSGDLTGEWETIAAGETQWHAFRSEGEGDHIDVLLHLGDDGNGIGGLEFRVYTPFQIQEWMKGEADVAPIGRGAKDEFVTADLSWKGNFVSAGTYFVVVENTAATPNSYSLTATGDDIWFEIAPAAAMEAMGADMPPTGIVTVMGDMGIMEAHLTTTGTGPAEALHISDEWRELGPGRELWFAFRSRGEGDKILAELHLGSVDDRTGFTIYTPQQIRAWQDGDDLKSIGAGSVNGFLDADLAWQGNFNVPETYFLRVENAGSLPSYFSLRISGDDLG